MKKPARHNHSNRYSIPTTGVFKLDPKHDFSEGSVTEDGRPVHKMLRKSRFDSDRYRQFTGRSSDGLRAVV